MTDEDPVHRLTHAPTDAVTIVLAEHDVADESHLQPLLADLPEGSTVIVLTERERAELAARAARSGDHPHDPVSPTHGPWTRDMDGRAVDACLRAFPGDHAKVVLLDNGFGGWLILPESAMIRTGPLPDDDPLVAVVRDVMPRDEQD